MRNNKKSKLFSIAVLTSMMMPLVTSCEQPNKSQDSTDNNDKGKNPDLPESSYKEVDVAFDDATYLWDGEDKTLKCDESALPSSITVSYSPKNTYSTIGVHTITASFKSTDGSGTLYKDKTARLIIKAPNDSQIDWKSIITFNSKTFEYDGTSHSIYIDDEEAVIPDGFAIRYEGNGQTVAGTHIVTAIIYNTSTNVTHYKAQATIKINKKKYDLNTIKKNLRFNCSSVSVEGNETYYNYNYSPAVTHRLLISSGLDSRLSAFYSGNERTEQGTNIVTIYFTSLDKNYEDPGSIKVNMRVRMDTGFKVSFFHNQTQVLDPVTVSKGEDCPYSAEELISRVQQLDVANGYVVSLTDENRAKLTKINANIDIFFTFTPRTYKVTYTLSNYSENPNLTEFVYGNPDGKDYNLVAPTVNDGYYFEGWFLKPDYSESSRITTLGNSASNLTIYGHVIKNNTAVMSFNSKTYVYDGKSKNLRVEGNISSDVSIKYTYYKLTKDTTSGNSNYIEEILDEEPKDIGIYKVVASFTDKVGTKYASDMTAFLTITETSYSSDMTFAATSFDWNSKYPTYPSVSNVPDDVTVKYIYYLYTSENSKDNNSTPKLITYDTSLTDDQVDDTHKNTLPVEPGNYLVEALFTVPSTHEEISNMYTYLTINKLHIVLDKDKVFPDVTQGFITGEEISINPITSAIPVGSDGTPLAKVLAVENNKTSKVGTITATAYFVASDPLHYYDPEPLKATLTVTQNNSHRVKFYIVTDLNGTLQLKDTKSVADNTPASAPFINKRASMSEGGLKFSGLDENDDEYYNAFEQKWFPCDENGHIIEGKSNLENVTEDTNFILTYVPRKYVVTFNIVNGVQMDPISYVAYHPYYSNYYAKETGDKSTNVYNGFSLKETQTISATANNNFEFLGWLENIPQDDVDRTSLYIKDNQLNSKYLFLYGNHTLTADIRGKFLKFNLVVPKNGNSDDSYTFYARYNSAFSTSSYDNTDKAQIKDKNIPLGYDFDNSKNEQIVNSEKLGSDYSLYSFLGYFDQFGNRISKDSIFTSQVDQNIYVKFAVKEVVVSFLFGNGTDNNTQKWNYNDTVGRYAQDNVQAVAGIRYLPANPTMQGYTFLGWTTDSSATKILNRNSDGSLPKTTFDRNGGSGNIFIIGYSGNTAKKVSELLHDSASSEYEDHISLYAIWVKDRIEISYQTNNSESDPSSPTTSQGGTFNFSTKKYVNYSEAFSLDAAPTLSSPSYKFLGWYYGDSLITKDTICNFTGADNKIILVAKWDTIEYTITYILNNDSSQSTLLQTIKYDDRFIVPNFTAPVGCTSYSIDIEDMSGNKITKFIISTKTEDLTKSNNLVNKSFKTIGIHENFICNIKWEGEELYLSFKDENGEDSLSDSSGKTISEQLSKFKTAYGTLPVPVKKGYDFGGWFYGTTRITSDTIVSTTDSNPPTISKDNKIYKNLILRAKWLAKTYNVNYSPNNGSSSQTVSVSYGSSVFVPKNFTKVGYVLKGWIDDQNNSYDDNFIFELDHDINLRANWVAKTYTAQFYDVSGAFKASIQVQYGQKFDAVLTKIGYEDFFPSKNYSVDGVSYSTKAYTADPNVPQFTLDSGSIINLNSYVCNQDLDIGSTIRFRAYGQAKTFTITFDSNRKEDVDGLISGDDSNDVATVMSCTYGQQFTPLSAPNRPGFTFVSWKYKHVFTSSSTGDKAYGEFGSDESIDFNSFNQMTDLIATAQWKAISYRVTFDYYNAVGNESQIYKYTDANGNLKSDVYYGSKISIPDGNKTFLPLHYKFLYWQNEKDSTWKLYSSDEFVFDKTEDLTFKAVYEEELEEEKHQLYVNLRFVNSNGNVLAEVKKVYCGQQIQIEQLGVNSKFTYGLASIETDNASMFTNPFTRFTSDGTDRNPTGEEYIILTAAPVINDFTIKNKADVEKTHSRNERLTLDITLIGSNVPSNIDAINSGLLRITSSDSSVCSVSDLNLIFNKAGTCTITITVNNLVQTFTITVQ